MSLEVAEVRPPVARHDGPADATEADADADADAGPGPATGRWSPVLIGGALVAVAAGLSLVHLTQGTAGPGAADILGLLTERDDRTWTILVGSRLPRLCAGLLVGLALGVAGATTQSIARNPLAAPDVLGVSAGGYFAVTLAATLGWHTGLWGQVAVAFAGSLAAAALVLVLAGSTTVHPTRLVLAGAATALALGSMTSLLLILFREETQTLLAWGSGNLAQVSLEPSSRLAPLAVLTVAALVVLARRLDLLALGDDAAAVLGVKVGATRLVAAVLAVVLAALAIVLAGPIGFVGLSAPAIVRLLGRRVPSVLRHRPLLLLSGLAGVVVVLAADVGLRAAIGADRGTAVPTGVVTTVTGAIAMIVMARRFRSSQPAAPAPSGATPASRTRRRLLVVLGTAALLLVVAGWLGLLLGDTKLLSGDLVNWLAGRPGPRTASALDERIPRVLAALLAGAALAVSGTVVQTVCRNALAEPGILGITAGAGAGAIAVLTAVPFAGAWLVSGAAAAGAVLAFAVVYGLAWRGGMHPDRLVLVGIALSAALVSCTILVIVLTDPWNSGKALTWLSGSTYARRTAQVIPVGVALVLLVPALLAGHRAIDLVGIDDDLPRLTGVRLERARLAALAAAVALTATAVAAVGVVAFVGLVSPHAARMLVGGRVRRVLPVAACLGALLVSVADTVGRTVIAPAQVPAGLLTALVGGPYFLWLLHRTRPV